MGAGAAAVMGEVDPAQRAGKGLVEQIAKLAGEACARHFDNQFGPIELKQRNGLAGFGLDLRLICRSYQHQSLTATSV